MSRYEKSGFKNASPRVGGHGAGISRRWRRLRMGKGRENVDRREKCVRIVTEDVVC